VASVSGYAGRARHRAQRAAASTQNQALSALLFLYRQVLGRELAWMTAIVRAKRPVALPVVLTRDEVRSLLRHLNGTKWLMASLLYGAGLRLLECCRLRIKDVDFGARQITVRRGKGEKDRVTMLPASLEEPLARHLEAVRRQHERDLARGREHGWVELPAALHRKYPNAGRSWPWQWVFPATRTYLHHPSRHVRRHTSTRPCCSAPCTTRCSALDSRNRRPATPSVIMPTSGLCRHGGA